jgi:hypothetical protein
MSESGKLSKIGQTCFFLAGILLLNLALYPLYKWLTTGEPVIIMRGHPYNGIQAMIAIIGFTLSGFIFSISSLKNLNRMRK